MRVAGSSVKLPSERAGRTRVQRSARSDWASLMPFSMRRRALCRCVASRHAQASQLALRDTWTGKGCPTHLLRARTSASTLRRPSSRQLILTMSLLHSRRCHPRKTARARPRARRRASGSGRHQACRAPPAVASLLRSTRSEHSPTGPRQGLRRGKSGRPLAEGCAQARTKIRNYVRPESSKAIFSSLLVVRLSPRHHLHHAPPFGCMKMQSLPTD
jgi:hypothetical protein